jgi:hypothetical protein
MSRAKMSSKTNRRILMSAKKKTSSRNHVAWAAVATMVLSCSARNGDPQPVGTSGSSHPSIGSGEVATTAPGNESAEAWTGAAVSPTTLAANQTLRDRLGQSMAAVDQARVLFTNCSEAQCTTRLETPTLTALRDVLQMVSQQYQGRINFVARERFDAYTGHSYQADVVLDTDQARAVPTDEAELTTNNGG